MKKARILVIDDEQVIREGLKRILESEGYVTELCSSGCAAMDTVQNRSVDLIITDLKMPGMSGIDVLKSIHIVQPEIPVVMITGYSTVDTAVDAMKHGAADYITKPFTPENILQVVRRAFEQKTVMLDDIYLKKELRDHHGFEHFIGESREMQKVYRRILQVAQTDSTVLITGESGTGKELVAKAIHNNSPRREQPFVAVDCTALSENLLESELFGHVKGSFTGAFQSKTGLFKVADQGTLLLDEVSNLSLRTQAKLLRALQEREITPIGGTRPLPVDIRLIAATNRDLKEMVESGEFREDLFFRLNIIPVGMPPLRERRDDLEALCGHFIREFSKEFSKDIRGIEPAAMDLLIQHDFPGNVRELENLIERAVVLAEGETINCADLELSPDTHHDTNPLAIIPRTFEELKERKKHLKELAVNPIERAFLLSALRRNDWNITRAAEEVGMQRPNFQTLLKKQGLSRNDRNS